MWLIRILVLMMFIVVFGALAGTFRILSETGPDGVAHAIGDFAGKVTKSFEDARH